MADYDLKSITADTDGPSADTELLFGSPDQSSGTPKPYSFAGIKTWIKSWIAKGDVGLGNVSNALQLTAASNLSDLGSAITARLNLGVTNKYVAGRYYWPPGVLIGSAAITAANRITLFPFRAPYTATISEFFTRIQAGSSGNFQCALYAASATTLLPTGTAVATGSASGSTTTGTTNVNITLTSNFQIQEGTIYWLAINADNASATFSNIFSSNGFYGSFIGDATLANMTLGSNSTPLGLIGTQTFGTWPDLTSVSLAPATAAVIAIGYKVTSVP